MGRHGLSRPDGKMQFHQPPPAHDRWDRRLHTGILRLRIETTLGRFVSPSTGRLTLTGSGSAEAVAQEAARTAEIPILPGSGIKGAVRNLYELLSFSCDPFERRGPCRANSCCDACSLFGRLGRNGRVSFADATPAADGSVRVEVRRVPIPFQGHRHRTPGDFRFYDLRQDTVPGSRELRRKDLSREVYTGCFETRMTFWNVTREELGRLLLAMGLGMDEKTRFPLRLGGVKYDGQGAVRILPFSLALATPDRRELGEDDCGKECAGWIEAARLSPWGGTFRPKLEEIAALLGSE